MFIWMLRWKISENCVVLCCVSTHMFVRFRFHFLCLNEFVYVKHFICFFLEFLLLLNCLVFELQAPRLAEKNICDMTYFSVEWDIKSWLIMLQIYVHIVINISYELAMWLTVKNVLQMTFFVDWMQDVNSFSSETDQVKQVSLQITFQQVYARRLWNTQDGSARVWQLTLWWHKVAAAAASAAAASAAGWW